MSQHTAKSKSRRTRPASGAAQSPSAPPPLTTHLLVVGGIRPAILTSTVWALAHEKPAVIPQRITAVTTTIGRDVIRQELFTAAPGGGPCGWEILRSALIAEGHDLRGRLVFGDTGEDLRVFTAPDNADRSRELDDLRTATHYECGADLLLDVVRTLTEVDDTRLIASVSGGRKPMVSLLAGAMGFLGRAGDRLVHVLVNEPFDSPALRPPLYFPSTPPRQHRYFDRNARVEREISSAGARLELVDIPLVRLRRLFAAEPQLYRSRYSVLARAYGDRISEVSGPIELTFDDATGVLNLNGHPVQLRGREHPFFAFLFDRWRRGEPPFAGHDRAYGPLLLSLRAWKDLHPATHFERDGEDWITSCRLDDIARQLASLRARLRNAGLENVADRLFPPNGPAGIPLGPVAIPARPSSV